MPCGGRCQRLVECVRGQGRTGSDSLGRARRRPPSSVSAANSPRALGSWTSWPRNGCASIVLSSSGPSCLVSRNISPFLLEIGRRVGTPHRSEMRWLGLQRGGEVGGGLVRLLRDLGIDHSDQQVAELRELLRRTPYLRCRHGSDWREQLIGVGRDAEVFGGVPGGQGCKQQSGEHNERCATAAVLHHVGEQAREEHRGPGAPDRGWRMVGTG